MKKVIYLSIFILAMEFNTFSQDYYSPDTTKFTSKTIYRIKAGLNLSNIYEKDDEEIYHGNQTNTGFHLGITAEFTTSKMTSFEIGLLLSTKGFKYKFQSYYGDLRDLQYVDINGKENLIYLDIPLTTKFYFNLIDDSKIYGVFGPCVSIGLGGKEKSTDTNLDTGEIDSYSDKITFGYNDKSWYNLFDVGLIAGVGIEVDLIQVGLTYNLGLISIDPYTEGGYKMKNKVLQLSVAYKFDLSNVAK